MVKEGICGLIPELQNYLFGSEYSTFSSFITSLWKLKKSVQPEKTERFEIISNTWTSCATPTDLLVARIAAEHFETRSYKPWWDSYEASTGF